MFVQLPRILENSHISGFINCIFRVDAMYPVIFEDTRNYGCKCAIKHVVHVVLAEGIITLHSHAC